MLDAVFISDVIGIEKPSVGFFHAVFEKIGKYNKKEIMIVGDSLTSDIQGGNNAGIVTCWYNPKGQRCNTSVKIDYEINDLNQILDIVF